MKNCTTLGPGAHYSVLPYYSISIIVFGTVGNILLILTIAHKNTGLSRGSRRRRRMLRQYTNLEAWPGKLLPEPFYGYTPSDRMLQLITINDLFCLWIALLPFIIVSFTGVPFRVSSRVACKLLSFLFMVTYNWSIALQTIYSFNRAIRITWPIFSRIHITQRKINLVLIMTLLFVVSKQSLLLIAVDTKPGKCGKCFMGVEDSLLRRFYVILEVGSQVGIGYPTLLIVNVCLSISLMSQKQKRCEIYPMRTQSTKQILLVSVRQSSDGRMMSITLLILSIIQIVTAIPATLMIEVFLLLNIRWSFVNNYNSQWIAIATLYSNHAVNYYILLIISCRFRKNAKHFFQSLYKSNVNAKRTC